MLKLLLQLLHMLLSLFSTPTRSLKLQFLGSTPLIPRQQKQNRGYKQDIYCSATQCSMQMLKNFS